MNYEKDMMIDESALDIEWRDQAALAFKYGRYWAECKQELQLAEENIKLVRSELTKEAFANSTEIFGNDKPTGPVVEAYYRNHKRHKAAKQEWVETTFEANMAEIAYKAITYDRKTALENLVKLLQSSYFAGPEFPRDLSEEIALKQTRSNQRVGEKLKRKKQ